MEDDKQDLLSIGEISKITGIGIQALRYYERKNILKPAMVDPDSGYRYYSQSQIYSVLLIMSFGSVDIRLKEMADAIESDDMESFRHLIEHTIEFAERKAMFYEIAAKAYRTALEKMELAKLYELGQIYSREFDSKIYLIKPFAQFPEDKLWPEIFAKMFNQGVGTNITVEDDFEDLISAEYGLLSQYSPLGENYYVFAEVAKSLVSKMPNEKFIAIPAGAYFFRQDERKRISDAREIFAEQIAGKDTYMIAELEEPMLSRTKLSQPVYELRLITPQ